MQHHLPVKTAVLAVVLVVLFVISWEVHLRAKGYLTDYDDGPELWARVRSQVYEPSDKATVFIGSSRIKFDLDIPTWQKLTGNHAIQLAMTGSSPRHFLTDLANDPKFKGKVVVDVTEGLFFSPGGHTKPDAGISFYHKRTPAQKLSFELGLPLEASLVMLNSSQFSIDGMTGRLKVPDRPEIVPYLDFPVGFDFNTIDRQNRMTDAFVADTNQWNQVRGIWIMLAKRFGKYPPISGKPLDTIMMTVKADVAKIKARGGEVIFTRTPSCGPYRMGEKMGFPRKAYYDRLLAETGCKGIYFEDYPATAGLTCPEWSHLVPKDAVIYTKALIVELKDKGWKL